MSKKVNFFICLLGFISLILIPIHLQANFEEIPDEKKELKFLKEPPYDTLLMHQEDNRPQKCPLKSVDPDELIHKMKSITSALKKGECLNQNEDLIKGIETLLNQTEQAFETHQRSKMQSNGNMPDLIINPSNPNTSNSQTPPSKQMNSYYFNLLNSITQISQNEECVSNIRKRGFVPVLADISTTLGQTAALVPTPNGFVLSLTGITLGATLKTLWNLFSSHFNWDDANERKQFQELNCNFFDIRKEIDASQILSAPNSELEKKIPEIKKHYEELLKKNENIKKRKDKFLKDSIHKQEDYVKENVGENQYKLLRAIHSLTKELKNDINYQKDTYYHLEHIQNIKSIMKQADIIKKLMPSDFYVQPYIKYVQDILNTFSWDKLSFFHEMDFIMFRTHYVDPLRLYLEEFIINLHSQEEIFRKNFFDQEIDPTKEPKKTKEYIDLVQKKYEIIEAEFAKTLKELSRKIAILEYKTSKKQFDAYDDSSVKKYDIIEEYKNIQELIYEKTGYSYVDFFRKVIKHEYYYFAKGYENLSNTKKEFNLFKVDNNTLPWLCKNTKQLSLNWDQANAASQVVFDFLETNRGIFHEQISKIKRFLYIFPSGKTRAYKLYRIIRSVDIAKKIMEKKYSQQEKSLYHFGKRKSNNLGHLMLEIQKSTSKRQKLEDFLIENKCHNFL